MDSLFSISWMINEVSEEIIEIFLLSMQIFFGVFHFFCNR